MWSPPLVYFLAKSYRFGQLIILLQNVETLRLLKLHIMFCPPAGAKHPFFNLQLMDCQTKYVFAFRCRLLSSRIVCISVDITKEFSDFLKRCSNSEAYLEPSRTSLMGFFCENSYRLKAAYDFRKKAPSQMFDWILNTPLELYEKNKEKQAFLLAHANTSILLHTYIYIYIYIYIYRQY